MKTKTVHTPGPWKLFSNAVVGQWQVLATGCRIATVARRATAMTNPIPEHPEGDEEAKANAQLIAAAPELLGALEWFASQLGDDDSKQTRIYNDTLGPASDDETVVQFLRRVIAKAKGK